MATRTKLCFLFSSARSTANPSKSELKSRNTWLVSSSSTPIPFRFTPNSVSFTLFHDFQRILPLLYNPSFTFWINSICSKTNSPFFSPNSNSFATKLFKTLPFFFSSHFSFHLDETGFYRRIPWKRPLHHMVDFFFCRFCPLPRVFLNVVTSKRSLSASNVTSLLQFVAANLLSIEPQLLPSLFTSIVYIPVQQSILVWFKVHFPSHLHP